MSLLWIFLFLVLDQESFSDMVPQNLVLENKLWVPCDEESHISGVNDSFAKRSLGMP